MALGIGIGIIADRHLAPPTDTAPPASLPSGLPSPTRCSHRKCATRWKSAPTRKRT
jgi:hypothetical protein